MLFMVRKEGKKMALQAEQDANASVYSKANAVSRTVSKSSHLYKNESWDLVDAEALNEVVIADLKDDALPNELKGKSTEAIKKYISIKKKERDAIQQKIQELNAKRKVFISEQKTENKNGLGHALTKAIKEQAKNKNYSWE